MTTLTWLAIGIGGVVGYVACAGLAWRLGALRFARCQGKFVWYGEWRSCQGPTAKFEDRCFGCDRRWKVSVFWPAYLMLAVFDRVVFLPLYATFRLTSGQLRSGAPAANETSAGNTTN